MTFSSRGHLSALVFFPTDHSGNFYQMQKLHLTIRANSIAFHHSGNSKKRADGKRVCGSSPESYAWSGRRATAAHRWSSRSGSIHWRSSIATHSPSTASGVAIAQRASNSRQKHCSVCSGSPWRSRPAKGQPQASDARPDADPPGLRRGAISGPSRATSKSTDFTTSTSSCSLTSTSRPSVRLT